MSYNQKHMEDCKLAPWHRQYCGDAFPLYWKVTYEILQSIDRDSRVIEIGCGLGNVTSILCYLGYKEVSAYEKDSTLAGRARLRIKDIFNQDNIVKPVEYPEEKTLYCDVLVQVNCAYDNHTTNKAEYLDSLRFYYESAGLPKYYLLEVIDASFIQEDEDFPLHIRLGERDVRTTFPEGKLKKWETYKFPENAKSKTLYLIERR